MKAILKALTEAGAQVWGMFCGRDGKLSWRRLIGAIIIIVGLAIAWENRTLPAPETLYQLVWNMAGVIIIAIGAFVWGMVTIQNIKDIAGKGKAAEAEK